MADTSDLKTFYVTFDRDLWEGGWMEIKAPSADVARKYASRLLSGVELLTERPSEDQYPEGCVA